MKREVRSEVAVHYERFIASEETAAYALRIARDMAEPDEFVHEADVVAGQRYLLACLKKMTPGELQMMTGDLAASLWARGSLGAARYRSSRGKRGRS